MGVARSWLRAPDVSYRANGYVSVSPGMLVEGVPFRSQGVVSLRPLVHFG